MDKKIKKKWVNALLSEEYNQGKNTLHDTNKDTFCCLGVLCDLAVKDGLDISVQTMTTGNTKYGKATNYLPPEVQEWAGLGSENPTVAIDSTGGRDSLANLNDRDKSFDEIAQLIKENL